MSDTSKPKARQNCKTCRSLPSVVIIVAGDTAFRRYDCECAEKHVELVESNGRHPAITEKARELANIIQDYQHFYGDDWPTQTLVDRATELLRLLEGE